MEREVNTAVCVLEVFAGKLDTAARKRISGGGERRRQSEKGLEKASASTHTWAKVFSESGHLSILKLILKQL